jgi:hypothetical protein
MAGKRFATDAEVKQAVTTRKEAHHIGLFYTGAEALVLRWDRWLNVNGECMESGVYHVLPCHNKVLGIRVFVTFLLKLFLYPLTVLQNNILYNTHDP